MAKILTMANQKGGVAKSTTALALAYGLHQTGNKVLFIDADPQCNTTKTFGAEIQDVATLYDLLKTGHDIEIAIQRTPNGDVVPCDPLLAAADRELLDIGKEFLLRKALTPIREQYDYIILDTQPSLGVLLINALTAADQVIVPVPAEEYAIQGLDQLMETIGKIQNYTNPSLTIGGLLMTRYNPRTNLSRDISAQVEAAAVAFGTQVYATRIRECNAVKAAQRQKRFLQKFAPNSTAAQDYTAFAAEIQGG